MAGLFFIAIGLVVGSFLNVVIHRLPRQESLVGPRSLCPQCKKQIRWHDNIPLLSFLILKAKCRDCGAKISLRYPLVEFLGGLSAWGAYAVWGFTPPLLLGLFLFWSLLAVTFIDFEHQIIPDEINALGVMLGLVFSLFYPAWHGESTHVGGLFAAVTGLLAGGGILWLIGWMGDVILKKESMGGGDVKLMAFLGTVLGWQGVLLTLFLASLIGAMVGLTLRMMRGQDRIPFGPYLALGAITHILAGNKIIFWYFTHVLQL